MYFGLSNNEKANATWLLQCDEDIKFALDFIKEKDIQSYEFIINDIEKNYAQKDKFLAYIDNAVIIAPVLQTVVEKTQSKYEIEGTINNILTLKRMICYDKTIIVDGKYKIIESTCFVLTPNVETLIFEEGVEYINDYVLCQFEKLNKIVFPESLKIVSSLAFENCRNLSSIEFKNPDTKYYESSFDGSVWSKNKTE
ncbi:MAG: hypothetical protein E7528_07620 [Ruminococcaceae bacterium]|nr:hypothetical protein [Oscillospiraceae bacterium]